MTISSGSLELNRLNIDVACVSECRIPGEAEFVEGEYTFLHSGRPPEQTKLEGVAIAIKNTIRPLVISWKGVSSRPKVMSNSISVIS